MSAGFVAKRREIVEHLQDGRLTLLEYGAYDLMILLADKRSGVWRGSAKALAANCGAGDVSDRQARHILEQLEKKRYIRRFPTPRSHRNYPILINKYLVRFGALSGMRLNAWASEDWRNPVYEKCPEHGAERAPIRDLRLETGEEEAAAASAHCEKQESWKTIGIEPCGPLAFRQLWQTHYASRDGRGLGETMGGCLDAWDRIRGKRPRPAEFSKALHRIRQDEPAQASQPDEEVPLVEAPE